MNYKEEFIDMPDRAELFVRFLKTIPAVKNVSSVNYGVPTEKLIVPWADAYESELHTIVSYSSDKALDIYRLRKRFMMIALYPKHFPKYYKEEEKQ